MLVKPTSFILRVIVIFLVASTFIFLVDPISNLFDTRDWNVALQAMKEPAFAFHSLRSVVIGVVLTVITELMFRLFGLNDEYVATIIDLKKELEKILDQARASTSALIAYQKFQPLLMLANSGLNPRFNSQIMAHAFREPKLAIPEASYRKYLITLIEANETAEIWRGVHVGSVDPLFGTNLDEDTRKLMAEYLKTLSKVRDKKRIVIRTEGKDDDWLADPQKVRRFLDITGLTTTSYYIRRSTATIILGDK